MTLKAKTMYSFVLLFLCLPASRGFMENFGGRRSVAKKEIRPDLHDVVEQQDTTQLNIQMHVGDEDTGFLTVKDMVIQLGGRYNENDEDRMKLPGDGGPFSECSTGGRRLNVLSKGSFVSMKGEQHIDCDKGAWEMCWVRGRPAGTVVFGFNIPQEYARNDAILPEGDMWLSFPVWTVEGLEYGQSLKREVLEEIEMYNRMWQEELDKYEVTDNPIMGMIYQQKAHIYATRADELYDYSLDTIPEEGDYMQLHEDLLLSKSGLIWKNHGQRDVLIGQAVASPVETAPKFSSFSTGRLRP